MAQEDSDMFQKALRIVVALKFAWETFKKVAAVESDPKPAFDAMEDRVWTRILQARAEHEHTVKEWN